MRKDKIEVDRETFNDLKSLVQVIATLGPGVLVTKDTADLARKCLGEIR